MTDCEGNGIGEVSRARQRFANNPPNHQGDLLLICSARAGDCSLHFAWCVKGHWNTLPGSYQRCDTGRLRGSDHRPNIVLAEHLLDSYRCGFEASNHFKNPQLQLLQPHSKICFLGGANHTSMHQRDTSTGVNVDDGNATTGQAWINSRSDVSLGKAQKHDL